MEKRIVGFQLGALNSINVINDILSDCYKATGQKFSINFNGSKGYLDNIEISAEEENVSENRIEYAMLRQVKNYNEIGIEIFFCKINGVRLEVYNYEKIKEEFFRNLK